MRPRFVGRLSLADAVTATNAALGFLAVAVAAADAELAARIVLLGAIADGLDGVVARQFGSSEAGMYLDSLADVASFGVAPAALVYAVVRAEWGFPVALDAVTPRAAVVLVVPAVFVTAGVLRLALYTAYDAGDHETEGVPTTLAATILAAAVLIEITPPAVLVAATGAFVVLMHAPIRYPDLLARDAVLMGVVQCLAIVFPDAVGRTFPYAVLTLGLSYLLLSPWLYWREGFPAPWTDRKGNA